MFDPKCVFCSHGNPAGAKYCNECGGPLHVKPCSQCDAINDRSARTCYKCGARFLIEPSIVEDSVESIAPELTKGFVASTVGGLEQEPRALDQAAADPFDTRRRREAPGVVADPLDFIDRSFGGSVTPSFSLPQRVSQAAPALVRQTSTRHQLLIRVALAMLVVAGAAMAVHFAYRHPAQVETGSEAARDTRVNAGAIRPPASVGSPPLSGGIGASTAATDTTTPLAAPTENAAPPVTGGRSGVRRPENEENAPTDSPAAAASPPTSPSDAQTTRAQTLANSVDSAAKRPPAPKAQSREALLPTPSRRLGATPSGTIGSSASPDAARPAVRPPLSNSRDDTAIDREQRHSCTEQVAALGLCNPRSDGEGK